MGTRTRTLGDLLKAWRLEKGISQSQAAKLASTGQATWHRWENGEQMPLADQLARIVAATRGALSAKALVEAADIRKAG